MIVHGAIVPPRSVLEELLSQVLPIKCVPPVEPEQRGLLRRLRAPAAPAMSESVLDPAPIDSIRLSVASFGNLTSGDVLSLTGALTAAAAEWTPPRVFFADVVFMPDERQFWAKLDGDIEGLTAVARGVGTSVERLGFYVDRRTYHPAIDLGTAPASAGESDIARVVEALGAFRGQDWLVDSIVLLTQTFQGLRSDWKQFELISVGHPG